MTIEQFIKALENLAAPDNSEIIFKLNDRIIVTPTNVEHTVQVSCSMERGDLAEPVEVNRVTLSLVGDIPATPHPVGHRLPPEGPPKFIHPEGEPETTAYTPPEEPEEEDWESYLSHDDDDDEPVTIDPVEPDHPQVFGTGVRRR